MTETWERSDLRLRDIINLENFKIITETQQREGVGGKSAIFICEDKYFIRELCPNIITVPKGVEVSWALITPKLNQIDTAFRQIAVASIDLSTANQGQERKLS